MTMKTIFFIIFLFLIQLASAQSVFELKNQKVIFAPAISDTQESVYTLKALDKMKFDDKYLYQYQIAGDTVIVTDVKHINSKKKSEAVLLMLKHRGNDVVYYIPLRFKKTDSRSFRNYIVGDKFIRRFGGDVNWEIKQADISDVDVICYNVDSVNKMSNYLHNKELWPVISKGLDKEWIQQKDCPYKFLKFEFKEGNRLSYERPVKTLHAVFEKADGEKWLYEVLHAKELPGCIYTNGAESTLDDLPNMFITSEEMKHRCEKLAFNRRELIDSILKIFEGKEIYIKKDAIPNHLSKYIYNITNNEPMNYCFGNNYFTLSEIKVMPIIQNLPHHALYAILTDSISNSYAIPVSGHFFDYAIDGSIHREEVAFKQQQKIIQQKELKLLELKNAENHKRQLIKKYGAANTNCILNGEIRLGFTSDMVKQSWGEPYDTSTITNANGTIVMWMYDFDVFVYFKNGKVVQIIN